MTISVTPDTLGPVTVRAHVSSDGIRIELFAANDLGRDAIRAILPELRRDLAGSGLGNNLDLSSQDKPTETDDERTRGERQPSDVNPASDRRIAEREAQPSLRPAQYGSFSTIDVMA